MILEKGVSPNVVTVRLDASKQKEFWFLLLGDQHWDNPKCDRVLLKKILDEAKECGAGILDCGDLFCAMQGKYDRRSNKSDIRPEHQTGDYLDALVRTAADFYEPYAHNIVSLGYGNHEMSILDRHESNLTERLAQTLRDRTGAPVPVTGYTGWIKFALTRGTNRTSTTLWHMHGYGGGGPVTKDTIQAQRQQAYVEGADILFSGHVHERWCMEHMKVSIDERGEVKHRSIWYVKSGTLKEEYSSGKGGWHVGTGKPPKPLGAWWLKITFDEKMTKGKKTIRNLISLEPTSGH
jgi:hypothetical protein